MKKRVRSLAPLADRGPLRVMFAITSMPVGGAETLLVNLCRRFNRDRVLPELCCLKERGPLGDELANEIPVHSQLLRVKWDLRILGRLRRLIRQQRIDAMITVGAGDKMFWGRLAAWWEQVPVIASALHSTGWPDVISPLNRRLTPITDAFIAVAPPHGRHLVECERFPADKVRVIPNGIDTQRFKPLSDCGLAIRRHLNINPVAPVVGIVAALRPEKNHELFLRAAAAVKSGLPAARFLVIGEGPERARLDQLTTTLGLSGCVHFLGNRSDVPRVLAACDLFALTSHNEANPVSILEALACGVPVVAPRVGSIPEMVRDGETGYLFDPGNLDQVATRWRDLLIERDTRLMMGLNGRQLVVECGSLDSMVAGYERLLTEVYERKVIRPSADLAPTCPEESPSAKREPQPKT